jgi:tetratricopeptide (TPR) repeat protein
MVSAGSSWRTAIMRPGEDPIGQLATVLAAAQVVAGPEEPPDLSRVFLEVTLRRSTLGLVEAVKLARLPPGENLLVIVDQFEELFRFRTSRQGASRDDAINFVRILIEAATEREASIFIVLTMRSDFIGECMNFPGLPEAINEGLYLVGRMSRERVRAAITGPVAVAGGAIESPLVNKVLNDLWDDHDQLPLMQHALMRTWDHWAARETDGPIKVEDYEAVGGFKEALSNHAEEAYRETVDRGLGEVAARMFKALTDTVTDPRGVRRPTSVGELAEIAEATEAQVIAVVECFRKPGRSFLMPPANVPLESTSIIDISHESLMRCWGQLVDWADEENAAASFYMRLAQAAAWHERGKGGPWRNPELELAIQWREKNAPTRAWGERYDPGFDRAMRFLDKSIEERDREAAAIERDRRAKLRHTQVAVAALSALLIGAIGFGWFATVERRHAQAERARAEDNLDMARRAVDESLDVVSRDPEQIGTDAPEAEELRRELMSRAEQFYREFIRQEPGSDAARRDLARAHVSVAQISRMLNQTTVAESEYRAAIDILSKLVAATNAPDDRYELGTAYDMLGETLRTQMGKSSDAAKAYEQALIWLEPVARAHPDKPEYQEDLALTYNNRGVFRWLGGEKPQGEADLREAIRILDAVGSDRPRTAHLLSRALNNLGGAMRQQNAQDAEALFQRSVDQYESLVKRMPDNREYQLELSQYSNNLAELLSSIRGRGKDAAVRNGRAIALLKGLARPAPSAGIELADAYNLRGRIFLVVERPDDATRSFEESLDHFIELSSAAEVLRLTDFHKRFGDLLISLVYIATTKAGPSLLHRAVDAYVGVATRIADGTDAPQAIAALKTLETITPALPTLPQGQRQQVAAVQERLNRVAAKAPR